MTFQSILYILNVIFKLILTVEIMTDLDARTERLARMSELGLALSELAGQLKRAYSNYAFIEPEEEPVFIELWNGMTDLEHVLRNYCHDMPMPAAEHYADVTGYVSIPMFSGDEIAAGYDWRQYPWYFARWLRRVRPKHFLLKPIDGRSTEDSHQLSVVKTLLSKPVPVPEGEKIDYEPRRPVGWQYVFSIDGKEAFTFSSSEPEAFTAEPIGIRHALLITAGDDGLAPEIPAKAVLLLDEDVPNYDGMGFYAFEKHESGQVDIAEVKPNPEGGFVYTSYRAHPKVVPDLSALRMLGKFRFIFVRDRASEPPSNSDFSYLDEE